MPCVWDVVRWLDDNVWESEDGPSLATLCWRDYSWNNPVCWVGDDHVALGGIGDDDEVMIDGARVFDVAGGAELIAFPGPQGAFFGDRRRLYAAAPQGLEVWDPFSGERTGSVPGFVPTHQHAAAGELAALDGARLRRWPTPRA